MVKLDNLFAGISELGLTAKKLSDATGISAGNISDWKNGRSMPSAIKLDVLANHLDCSVDYILGRTDTPLKTQPSNQAAKLRFIGVAAPQVPLEISAEHCELLYIKSISYPNVTIYPNDMAVEMRGNSMTDAGIYNKDYVVFRPSPVAENGQIVLAAVGSGCIIRNFCRTDGGIELHPCNTKF